jgi:aryl-alcohol dehydrogenase-like predicted oxidoreductase
VARGARFGFLAQTPGMSGAQAALAWVLSDPSVSAAVCGVTRMRHLMENLAASGLELPPEIRAAIAAAQGA